MIVFIMPLLYHSFTVLMTANEEHAMCPLKRLSMPKCIPSGSPWARPPDLTCRSLTQSLLSLWMQAPLLLSHPADQPGRVSKTPCSSYNTGLRSPVEDRSQHTRCEHGRCLTTPLGMKAYRPPQEAAALRCTLSLVSFTPTMCSQEWHGLVV